MEFVLGDKLMAQLAIADIENPELARELHGMRGRAGQR